MNDFTLEQIDADGALDEAIDGFVGSSRAAFLRSAVLGGEHLSPRWRPWREALSWIRTIPTC